MFSVVVRKHRAQYVLGSSVELRSESLAATSCLSPKSSQRIFCSIVVLRLLYLILMEEIAMLTLQRVELL